MTDQQGTPWTRQRITAASQGLGWRLILGSLHTAVPTGSVGYGLMVATRVIAACGVEADGHLSVDIRSDRVLLRLQTQATNSVTRHDIELTGVIAEAFDEDKGFEAVPFDLSLVGGPKPEVRSVQGIEIGIDALNIAAIRPFWKAILDYVDEPGTGPDGGLIDGLGQGPAIWFQQMDAPRPQRNRIHLDIAVPDDVAPRRMDAALTAGGTLLYDAEAPAFWVLGDVEGNEACITTWQGRDP